MKNNQEKENLEDLKMVWNNGEEPIADYLEVFYEKGIADDYRVEDGEKVKQIIGYYEDEDGEEDADEIGYIVSKGKNIEDYNDEELFDFFYKKLEEVY